MNLETREDGAVTILTVTGDLVIGEAETAFKKTVTRLLEEGRVNLLVDLSCGRISRQLGARRSGPRPDLLSQKEGGHVEAASTPGPRSASSCR